jgi:hypothetical protein
MHSFSKAPNRARGQAGAFARRDAGFLSFNQSPDRGGN